MERFDDCPECRSAGSVVESICEVCYAEFDEAELGEPVALFPLASLSP